MFCSQQKSSVDILPFLTPSHRFDGLIVKSSFGSIYFAKSLPHQGDLPRSEHWPYYYKRLWTNSQTYVCCSCCVHIKLSGWFRFCSWSLFIYQLVFQNCRVAFIKRGRRISDVDTVFKWGVFSLILKRGISIEGCSLKFTPSLLLPTRVQVPNSLVVLPSWAYSRSCSLSAYVMIFFNRCHKCRKREWFESSG